MLNRLQDVFKYFEKHDVKYIVIGGIASILYGVPRTTFDLDILIEASAANVQKLLDALIEAGFGTALLTSTEKVLENEITIFADRVRIDVQTHTPGITFAESWNEKQIFNYQGQKFYILSKKHLIQSKKAAGRDKDLNDVKILESDDDLE